MKVHFQNLNKIIRDFYTDPETVIIIFNMSIKNNITSTEAELFVIRCSIDQAVHFQDIYYIIVITDTIHLARQIFNSFSYSYQL